MIEVLLMTKWNIPTSIVSLRYESGLYNECINQDCTGSGYITIPRGDKVYNHSQLFYSTNVASVISCSQVRPLC